MNAVVERTPDVLADFAVVALHAEAMLTPKPGLVDQAGTGAHTDMTLRMLLRSAEALRPTFSALARLGGAHLAAADLRARIGEVGRAGEAVMLESTGGVNTHRGAIWTVGLLVTAAGGATDESDLLRRATRLAGTTDPAGRPRADSNGQRAGRSHGVTGAVGEAAAGFPHIVDVALPHLRSTPARFGTRHAQHRALLGLIATVDDTCVLHRGGSDGLRWMQRSAARTLRRPERRLRSSLARFAVAADRRHLSPGGSADLLAGALFVDSLATCGFWATAHEAPDTVEESLHAIV